MNHLGLEAELFFCKRNKKVFSKLARFLAFDNSNSVFPTDADKVIETIEEPSEKTLKSYITTEISPSQVVYERLYPNSIPQIKRDSYFLTEMFNIKSMLRHQVFNEEEMELKFKTDCVKGFTQSQQTTSPYYSITSPEDKTLVFESRFESGNLCMAIKVNIYPTFY